MELNFKSFGEGEPVIIVHGLFGMLDNWQTFAKRLAADGYLVYLVDLRNHGKSPWSDEFNYELLANDLLEWMHSQGIYRSSFIGHSMGGKAIMQLALEHPSAIDKLIVVDIAPWEYTSKHTTIFNALLSIDLSKLESRSEAASELAMGINNISTVQFLLKNLARNKHKGFRWKANLESLYNNYDKIRGSVISDHPYDGYALFLYGDRSDYLHESDLERIRGCFSNAELQVVHDSGHWMHVDKPDELHAAVTDFLAR